MATPYWKTDRVNNINKVNLLRSIEFLNTYNGGLYSDLSSQANMYFHKPATAPYFGQIVTHINILGLFVKNNNGTFTLEELPKLIFEKPALTEKYLEYFLLKFQYPRPHISDDGNETAKPFLLTLKILVELWKVNPEEAYLTDREFYLLFQDEIRSVNHVNEELINRIIFNNREWGRAQVINEEIRNILSYDKALLLNSEILSKEKNKFPQTNDLFLGLDINNTSIDYVNFLINFYSEVSFNNRNGESSDLKKNNYARYMNSIPEFYKFINQKNMLQYTELFISFCSERGFYFDENLVRRFSTSLLAKPFLLLTGISGTGKSKIAELFGEFLRSKGYGDFLIKAVGSNWTDNKNLLGYFNPIIGENGLYVDTDVVRFIKLANDNPEKTFVLLLDEMNLSYTERYFSDFLSGLESLRKEITLADSTNILWSQNLKIIGTINEDETTHTLSPKVIDRANIIEMNGSLPSGYIADLTARGNDKVKHLNSKEWKEVYIEKLDKLHEILNGKFGYRTIDEMTSYILINSDYTSESYEKFLDEQIYQKLLPKLHGTRGELLSKLEALYSELNNEDEKFSKSCIKVQSMIDQLKKTGFTSFVTA